MRSRRTNGLRCGCTKPSASLAVLPPSSNERRCAMSRSPRNRASFPPANDGGPMLLPLLNPADWQEKDVPSREWAWADYIPHRQATYLTGPGSAGKSLLSQQLCTCIALGLPFMGKDTRQAVAIYVTCEDDADELHRRQKAICDALCVPLSALSGKLHIVRLTGRSEERRVGRGWVRTCNVRWSAT